MPTLRERAVKARTLIEDLILYDRQVTDDTRARLKQIRDLLPSTSVPKRRTSDLEKQLRRHGG
jgi:hypothetical protein